MRKKIIIGIIILVVVILVVYVALFAPSINISDNTGSITPTIMQGNSTANDKVKIEDLKVGSGQMVKSGDTIVVNYKGTLTNGKQFDSSYDRHQPFTTQIGVGRVIKGWDEGILGMKVGGIRRLTIPPSLGYGSQGAGADIPPNATLIFEVELVSIK